MKKLLMLLLMAFSLMFFVSCKNTDDIKLENIAISHETKFGGIYINITIDEIPTQSIEIKNFNNKSNILLLVDFKCFDWT